MRPQTESHSALQWWDGHAHRDDLSDARDRDHYLNVEGRRGATGPTADKPATYAASLFKPTVAAHCGSQRLRFDCCLSPPAGSDGWHVKKQSACSKCYRRTPRRWRASRWPWGYVKETSRDSSGRRWI